MALLNRVSQLFKADFNAVLDQIEEPEQILKQAIRDMEDELANCEKRIAACAQEQEALTDRSSEVQATASELDDQLDLCFESGKDDLARGIVRRKLESGRLIKHLGSRQRVNTKFLDKERRLLEENSATLESLRQKAELFVSRIPAEESFNGIDDFARISRELCIGDDEVEIAFLREKSARSVS